MLGIFYVGLNTFLMYPIIQILVQIFMCSTSVKFKNSDHVTTCYKSVHAWMVTAAILAFLFTIIQFIISKYLMRELNPLVKSPWG